MEDQDEGWALKGLVVVLFIFLLAPVLLVIPLSFSGETTLRFPPATWSLRWYAALWHDTRMQDAFRVSTAIGATVAAATILVALPAAYAIVRIRSAFTRMLHTALTTPLLLPTIVIGLALLIAFARFHLLGTYTGIVLGHLVLTMPYGLRVLVTAVEGISTVYQEAARTLGAGPATAFRRVAMPLMLPGIVSAASLSFLVSFDEAVVTLFLAGPQVTTLPVELFRRLDQRSDPLIAAVSVVMILVTLLVVIVVQRSIGLSKGFLKS